jgi:hypothetical protein
VAYEHSEGWGAASTKIVISGASNIWCWIS